VCYEGERSLVQYPLTLFVAELGVTVWALGVEVGFYSLPNYLVGNYLILGTSALWESKGADAHLPRYSDDWFHCFDGFVVTVRFVADVATMVMVEVIASIVIVLRL
jgi:hypothetical protein